MNEARVTREGIRIHGPEDFAGMHEAGRVAATILDEVGPLVVHGLTPDLLAAGRPADEVREELAVALAGRVLVAHHAALELALLRAWGLVPAAVVDTQSVMTTESGGPRGWDAAKRLKGRKRHVAVDADGLLRGVVAHAANVQDADGFDGLLKRVRPLYVWLRAVLADSA